MTFSNEKSNLKCGGFTIYIWTESEGVWYHFISLQIISHTKGRGKDLRLILTFLNLNNPQYIHTCSLQCLLSLRSTSENLKVCLFHFYFQSYIHFYGGWRDWNKFNMKIQTFSRWKTQYKGSVMFSKNSPLNWCFFIIIIIILVHQIIQKCTAN